MLTKISNFTFKEQYIYYSHWTFYYDDVPMYLKTDDIYYIIYPAEHVSEIPWRISVKKTEYPTNESWLSALETACEKIVKNIRS